MAAWFPDNPLSIGPTPLVRLTSTARPAPKQRSAGEPARLGPHRRYLSSALFAGPSDAKGIAA